MSDAERHLRLVGERDLFDVERRRRRTETDGRVATSPVVVAAAALIAVGAIERESAERIIADYALAEEVRSGTYAHGYQALLRTERDRADPVSSAPAEISRPRVVAVDRRIERPGGAGYIRFLSLAEGRVTIGARLQLTPPPVETSTDRWDRPWLPQFGITDDRDAVAVLEFFGDDEAPRWSGVWHSDDRLANDTEWISVLGERIALAEAPDDVEVRIEGPPTQPPAWRHLDRVLAGPHGHGDVRCAVEALLAVGVIDRADPRLDELDAARDAVEEWDLALGSGHRARPAREPWQSLRRLGYEPPDRAGRTGVLPVGAVTSPFDGVRVGIVAVELDPYKFHATVEVRVAAGVNAPFDAVTPANGLIWWAADDRGNSYLGDRIRWGRGGFSHGRITFEGGLDPQARRLDIIPTAWNARAVISVPVGA